VAWGGTLGFSKIVGAEAASLVAAPEFPNEGSNDLNMEPLNSPTLEEKSFSDLGVLGMFESSHLFGNVNSRSSSPTESTGLTFKVVGGKESWDELVPGGKSEFTTVDDSLVTVANKPPLGLEPPGGSMVDPTVSKLWSLNCWDFKSCWERLSGGFEVSRRLAELPGGDTRFVSLLVRPSL
jgi:hypothetical protein